MFSEIWRSWVEMVLKSLKRWGEGRFLNPPSTPPTQKKPTKLKKKKTTYKKKKKQKKNIKK